MEEKRETIRVLTGPNILQPCTSIQIESIWSDDLSIAIADLVEKAKLVNQELLRAKPQRPQSISLDLEGEDSAERCLATFIGRTALALQQEFYYLPQQSSVHSLEGDQLSIVYEFEDARIGRVAGQAAQRIWQLLLYDQNDPLLKIETIHKGFLEHVEKLVDDLSNILLVQEAAKRGIPSMCLFGNDIPFKRLHGFWQLGQGNKGKRFIKSITSETSVLSWRLSTYKSITSPIFKQHGIPVPTNGIASSPDEAVKIAERIGFPVVIKPLNMDMGTGVHVGIETPEELQMAFAEEQHYRVLNVEKHIAGFDHRLTFVKGRFAGVVQTRAPFIEGDGASTIQQLLDAPRKKTSTMIRGKIKFDDEVTLAIEKAGYAVTDILPKDETIILRKWWRNGGDYMLENVTDQCHPENIDMARLAVELVDVDVVGIDFISPDVSVPFHANGGAVTEANASPALAGAHVVGVPVYSMMLEAFFADGEDGRVPTLAIVGGDSEAAENLLTLLRQMLEARDICVGVASPSQLTVSQRMLPERRAGLFGKTQFLCSDPRVEVMLLGVSTKIVHDHGFPIDCVDTVLHLQTNADDGVADVEIRDQVADLVTSLARKSIVASAFDSRAVSWASSQTNVPIYWVADEDSAEQVAKYARSNDAIVTLGQANNNSEINISKGSNSTTIAVSEASFAGKEDKSLKLLAHAAIHAMGLHE